MAERLDVGACCQPQNFDSAALQFRLVPNIPNLEGSPPTAVITILSSTATGGRSWKWQENGEATRVKLLFKDFFDWSNLGYRDLRYYLVRVQEYQGHPEWVGVEALMDVQEADVVWDGDLTSPQRNHSV